MTTDKSNAASDPQPAELSFDVEAMLTACVPGGSIVDPQVVADNIRAWVADHKPAELANASVVEQIAQQWDGCQYDAPGEMVDIGAAIRRAGKRLSAKLAEQQGVGITATQIDSRLNALYRQMVDSGQHNGGMSGVAWDRAVYRAALAARQPGAQERVAWASTGATGHKVVAMPGLHKLPYGDYDLYAAPSAQGIDLGQLRSQVLALTRRVEPVSGQRFSYVQPDDVLALIDNPHDAAPAQGIDLGQVREIRIPARNKLDPISVFVQDQAAGRGRIVVTCYGNAWQAFWGAMGDRTVMEFVAQCDADYVAGNMLQGRQTRIAKHEREYAARVAAEVIAEFRALTVQRDAAPGVGS